MKNYKGFASISLDEYKAKMKQLKVSYFMQCMDLTNAFNGDNPDEAFRNDQREMMTYFIDRRPEASFTDFCISIGETLTRTGHMSREELQDILDGKEIDND